MSRSSLPPTDRQPASRLRGLTGWRGALASLAFGALLFGLLEAVLALIGFAPVVDEEDPFVGFASSLPLFVESDTANGARYLETAANKLRFFNEQRFVHAKTSSTYRIFCLGGSTTYGRPYDDETSFPGWLRELLRAADPERQWQVVNAGGISYASYRVAELMRELAEYEPDLFIIYSGHNEFLEERTYGALRDLPAPVRATAAVLSRTRTWTALGSLLRRLRPAAGAPTDRQLLPAEVDTRLEHSAGPERYERDDRLTEQVVTHYRFNLERMIGIGRRAGAEVMVVSPAANLKDCSPFKSQHSPDLDPQAAARAASLLQTARGRLPDSPGQALALLDEAIGIDPRYAELHFRRGEALLALGRSDEALAAFTRAADEDVCPLRAITPLRRAVEEVARATATMLIDFRGLLEREAAARHGRPLPGSDFFLDHVHPSIEGNRLLALELIRAMTDRGIVRPGPGWGPRAVTAVTRQVEGGIDAEKQARALANLAVVLSWAGKSEDARRLAEQALDSGAADPTTATLVIQTLARQAASAGDVDRALAYYRRALEANPLNPETHLQIGLLLTSRQRLEAAAAHLFMASVIWPENPECHRQLGFVMAARGRYDVALSSLSEADRLDPGRPATKARLARIRQRFGAAPLEPFKLSMTKHPSGSPRRLTQARRTEAGYIPDGIWTEWHENGLPRRFADYRDGVPHGVDTTWDAEGRLLGRRQHPAGLQAEPPGPGPS